MLIRPARHEDIPLIAVWTERTSKVVAMASCA